MRRSDVGRTRGGGGAAGSEQQGSVKRRQYMNDGGSRSARGGGAGGASYGDLGMTTPHPARMYDFYLGGKTNYAVDRESANKVTQIHPQTVISARHNRWFMHRATRYLAGEVGISQFLDIGTGIPTEPNLHQVAQASHPDSRVVYTDNDPIVLSYARALLTGTEEGVTDYIEADVRDPQRIIDHARGILDFEEPIALSVIALFHFVADADDPIGLTNTLMDALPSGSALVLSHATADLDSGMQLLADTYMTRGITCVMRPHEKVMEFFDGLEMVEPGLVPTCDWRPHLEADGLPQLPGMVEAADVGVWAGLGIKP